MGSLFISKISPEIRAETCLVILSVLSYLTPKRNDLMSLFKLIFFNYIIEIKTF